MNAELIKLSEIKKNPNNPRILKDDKFKKLVKSITEFPEMLKIRPIVVNDDMVVLGGNMRLKACKEAGLTEVPIIKASDLTDEQQKEFIIKDNVGFGEWDWEMLANEWDVDELDGWGLDVDYSKTEQEKEGLTDEDETPEPEENPKAKRGDVWILGDHTLMCGDSTDEKDIQTLLKNKDKEKTHFISDPPYGIAYDPKTDKYGMIKNDDTFLDFIGLAKKYSDGFFFMWTGYQVVDEWIKRIKEEFDKITNMIIWHKGGGGMGDCARTLATDFEIALVVNRKNKITGGRGSSVWMYNQEEREEFLKKAKKEELREALEEIVNGQCVWKVSKDNTAEYLHPTQKPVEINQRALTNFTTANDNVIDLFLGSGSNLIACEKTNRKCFGMELDPVYVDVIIKRWQDFTGNDAILEQTGQSYNSLEVEGEAGI